MVCYFEFIFFWSLIYRFFCAIEEIKREILSSDVPVSYGDDYDDLENMDFIYHWYITNRLGSCFHDDFNFFVNIINNIQT